MGFKAIPLVISLCLTLCLCGCALTQKGNSLSAFCERVNSLEPDYSITPEGFIVDKADETLTKYFKLNGSEIMVQLEYDDSNSLTTLHIVFDNSTENNPEKEKFLKNILYAFINDTQLSDSLFIEADLENSLSTININTKKTKIGNTELLLDVTEIGTVISVVQNIP